MGNKRGLKRILASDGRSLVVAMDHAAGMRNIPQLADPQRVIEEVVSAGADAIITTFGTARTCADQIGATGLILTVSSEEDVSGYAVEQAIRLGADAIKVEAFPDSPTKPLTMAHLRRLAAECDKWNMPLVAEMIPVAFDAKEEHTAPNVARAARMGAEAGADIVKVHYTGSAESFSEVTDNCYVPALILGGPRGADDRALLEAVAGALEGGAAGVAFGRNIWAHPNPGAITRALKALIHNSASVEAALDAMGVTSA